MRLAFDASRFGAFVARALLAWLALAVVAAPAAMGGGLDLRISELASGARLVLAESEQAGDGRVSMRLVIDRGASADPIGGAGAAHVLSHALWDTAMDRLEARAGAGGADAANLLRAMGGRRPTHRAAPIDMFSMGFGLDLLDANDAAVREGLALLSGIASLDDLTDETLLKAKAAVEQELRGWSSPYLRVNQRATKAIFEPLGLPPGPFVGREAEVATLTVDDLRGLAESLFAHSAVTLVVAGRSVDKDVIAGAFTPALAERAAFCPMVVVDAVGESRSIVIRDKEATSGVVEVLRVERDRIDANRALVREAAANAVRRRLELAASRGTGGNGAGALGELIVLSKPHVPGAMGTPGAWLNLIHVMTGPDELEGAFGLIAEELRRVDLHGYTEGERRLAVERALAPLRDAARAERAGEPREIADRLARRVGMGEAIESAEASLAAAERVLASVSADDLRDEGMLAFLGSGAYQRRGIVALAATNESSDVREEHIETALRVALASTPAPLDASASPPTLDRLHPSADASGEVVEVRIEPETGVLTMTLSNGLVVHHRAMAEASGEVVIHATVGGGEIDEINGTPRGITEAALSAWREPATLRLRSSELSDALVGTGVEVRAYPEQDALRLRVRGTSDASEAAALMATALLTEPRVESAALERWKQSAREQAGAGRTQPFDRLRRDLWAVIEGTDDPRVRFPDAADVERIDVDAAQAWLDRALERGDVEVAIVGAVSREKAVEYATRLLTSVPARPAVSAASGREGVPSRNTGAVNTADVIESLSKHGAALVGLTTGEGTSAEAWAMGEVASRALTPLVRDALAGDAAIANEPRSLWLPMEGWDGFSLLYTPMVAPAEHVERAAEAAWGVYERLAREGLTASQMEEARESVRRTLSSSMEEPDTWARALSGAQRRGVGVRALLDRRAAVMRLTPEDVRGFLSSSMERGGVRTIVLPASEPGGA
ncbi:MAG: hypothetical protein ACTS27_05085, partial [Phycisphaerales bacterium]